MNGHLANAIAIFNVRYRIKQLILQFYNNWTDFERGEFGFLFHIELAFDTCVYWK